MTETRPTTDPDAVEVDSFSEPTAVEKVIGSGDHLTIGRGFVVASLVGLLISGAGLLLSSANQLSDDGIIGLPEGMWTSSLVGLVVLAALPLLIGLGFAVVPRQLASPAIAFPAAAALSLWTWAIAGVIYVVGVLMDGGIGGTDIDGVRLSVLSLGAMLVALSVAMSCIATTVLSHRPLGMGLSKVPFFSWSMLVAAPVWILSFASATAHVLVGQISHTDVAGFAGIYSSGIEWLFGAPAVYMLAIPVLGIAADVAATAAQRRINAYGVVQGIIGAYAILSFGAWTQVSAARQTFIWVAVVVIAALPLLALLGALADTLRRGGKPAVTPALVASLLGLVLALLGVLLGALQALDTAGTGYLWAFDNSALRWGQGVFLLSAALVGGLGGAAYWSRQIFSTSSVAAFGGASIAVLIGGGLVGLIFAVQAIAAADGGDGLGSTFFNAVVAIGGLLLVLGALGGLFAALSAARGDTDDGEDLGDGLTLEWAPAVGEDSGLGDDQPDYVLSPYPLLDQRGESGEDS